MISIVCVCNNKLSPLGIPSIGPSFLLALTKFAVTPGGNQIISPRPPNPHRNLLKFRCFEDILNNRLLKSLKNQTVEFELIKKDG